MILNVKVNSDDDFSLDGQENKELELYNSNSFSYTFWQDKKIYKNIYNTNAIDLLNISFAVFACDRLELRDAADDCWSREFIIYMPVVNVEIWDTNKETLENMLSFLSGDSWKFIFRTRHLSKNEDEYKKLHARKEKEACDYDRLCMFSGGMDSYIGAINLLEENLGRTLFVSHYGGGKGTKEYQDYIKEKLIEKYSVEDRDFCQFYAKVVNGVEDTTRSRSFMFFSHAVALASALNKSVEVIIPENGLISLNIPLSYSRIGTSSTRTTHPYYMSLFQKLVDNLGLNVQFRNPYQFKTKGEMLLECKNQEFMKNHVHHTMSCSHPDAGRMQGEKTARHCGYCVPCVIRQAALKKAGINDISSYRDSTFSNMKVSKQIRNSYLLAIEKFNPKYAFMSIQLSGKITDHIDDYTDLYVRGMNEFKDYIEGIVNV
uniref:Putative PP-loop superfamily ATPase n=1 Tax=Eubacterium cellulosolvens (strain ATCC 43171 / JCM 9499 / 6) TaxID=633697 RepID=I5AWU2_EUBC6